MLRREFLAFLGGTAATWPLVARAQPAIPVVGFALSSSAAVLRTALAGFEDGLKDSGYIAGQNVAIEYRFADGQFERFPGVHIFRFYEAQSRRSRHEQRRSSYCEKIDFDDPNHIHHG